MKCPVCGTGDKTDLKSVFAWVILGILVGFILGQLFYSWQVSPVFRDKLKYLDKANQELKEEIKKAPPPKKGINY
jgi:MFS superfamily sulfate permease-like transporter